MARIHGKKGAIYLAPGAGAAVALTNITEWSINYTTDKVETTAMQDSNKTYVVGLPDLQGTFSGFYDYTDSTLFDAAVAAATGQSANMIIYPDTSSATTDNYYAYGTAFVDATISGGVNAPVAIRGSFAAAGNWVFDSLVK